MEREKDAANERKPKNSKKGPEDKCKGYTSVR